MQSGTWAGEELGRLALEVGGVDALDTLDDCPVPDEPFDWSLVTEADRDAVGAILDALEDGVLDTPHQEFLGRFGFPLPGVPRVDTEYRTIARRLLALIASADPRSLRKSSARRNAAAILWLAMRSNDAFDRRFRANDLWDMFGVSSCTTRGWELRAASGLADLDESELHRPGRQRIPTLPDASLLHSSSRIRYIEARDRYIGYAETAAAERERARPIRNVGNGQMHIRARPITPRWALTAIAETGRATVMVTVGETDDDVEVLALSIPDARRLMSMIGSALAAPFPQAVQPRH